MYIIHCADHFSISRSAGLKLHDFHSISFYITAEPSVPSFLLEAILESQLPLSPSQANVSGESDTSTLHGAMQDLLALQLEVASIFI